MRASVAHRRLAISMVWAGGQARQGGARRSNEGSHAGIERRACSPRHAHRPGTARVSRGGGPITPRTTAASADHQGEDRSPDRPTDQRSSGRDTGVRLAFRWLKNHFLTAQIQMDTKNFYFSYLCLKQSKIQNCLMKVIWALLFFQ